MADYPAPFSRDLFVGPFRRAQRSRARALRSARGRGRGTGADAARAAERLDAVRAPGTAGAGERRARRLYAVHGVRLGQAARIAILEQGFTAWG